MCLPLIPKIKKKYPNALITWVCGKQVEPLLSKIPEIDRLIVVDEKSLLSGSVMSRLACIFSVWKQIAFQKFDRTLYFYFSPLYKILILPASKGRVSGFNKKAGQRFNPVPGRHHSWDYINTFEEGNGPVQYDIQYPAFPYFNPSHLEFKSKASGKKIIALSCGGAKNILRDDDLRRWPIEHYRSLAQLIVKAGYEIYLTGAPSDAWVKDSFNGIEYQDFIGKLDLPDFVSLLKTADLLITHDSGPLHLADLANCPVLGLFGPTIPHEKASLNSKSAWLWGGENLQCRPCYDGRDYQICASNDCLKSVSPLSVFNKMEEMMANLPSN